MYEQVQSPVIGLGVECHAVPWRQSSEEEGNRQKQEVVGIFVGTLDLVFVPFLPDKQTMAATGMRRRRAVARRVCFMGTCPESLVGPPDRKAKLEDKRPNQLKVARKTKKQREESD